jgi:hypothetical protein
MQRFRLIALFVALAASYACGQQTNPFAAPAQPERVKVYAVGPGVTAPELLPLNVNSMFTGKCNAKVDGKVELSLLVDTTGHPRNIMFLKPLGTELDRSALRIASTDRFKPGTLDGKPVVVAESMKVDIQSCVVKPEDSTDKAIYKLRLRTVPQQELGPLPKPPNEAVLISDITSWKNSASEEPHLYHVGSGVTAPFLLTPSQALYTPEACKAQHTCSISLVVDQQGMPQNVQVKKAPDPGLGQNLEHFA